MMKGLWGLSLGTVLLAVAACDGENLFAPSRDVLVVDLKAPTVQILLPSVQSPVAVGDSVLVQARLQDNRGVDSVRFEGFSRRGNPTLGTDVVVERFSPRLVFLAGSPADSVLARHLVPVAGDATRERAFVAVTAWDSVGNAAADTVAITIGGPDIRFVGPAPGSSLVAGASSEIRWFVSDPIGVVRAEVEVSGAFSTTLVRDFTPAVDSATVDAVLAVPAGVSGPIRLVARAINREGSPGISSPISLQVIPLSATDSVRPTVRVSLSAAPRLERGDSVSVEILSQDPPGGTGLVRSGFTLLAISANRGDTVVLSGERSYSDPRTGEVAERYSFPAPVGDTLDLPDAVTLEAFGWAIDRSGNCAVGTRSDAAQSLGCREVSGVRVADGSRGLEADRQLVQGRTVLLPNGGQVMDAAVDTIRRTLLLSNQSRNQVEVFRLGTRTFGAPLGAGSRPWGLAVNRNGDTLLVANSGGTDISRIFLGDRSTGAGAGESSAGRILSPFVSLWEIVGAVNTTTGAATFTQTIYPAAGASGFSDRPQYMVQDSTGRVMFSTVTSNGAGRGTVRKLSVPPGGERPEIELLYEHAGFGTAPGRAVIARADSFSARNIPILDSLGAVIGFTPEVTIVDHLPGFPSYLFPSAVLRGQGRTLADAVLSLQAQGSDILYRENSSWDLGRVTFGDTTFVTTSGDRGWVLVGEGATADNPRILMYEVGTDRVSGVLEVNDILTNAGETVFGIGLNHDGTLGVARGRDAYFFNDDLRLRGVAALPLGGAGSALHPLHSNAPGLRNPLGRYEPNTHLAFLGTGENTIDIVDTFRFRRIGRIELRDVVTGPLRATLPFPGDNAGLDCQPLDVFARGGRAIGRGIRIFQDANGQLPFPAEGGATDDACVIVKLFGVTSAGGVVVVDVRKADILREHPARLN